MKLRQSKEEISASAGYADEIRCFSVFEPQLFRIVSTVMNIGINFLSFMVISEFLFQVMLTIHRNVGL